MKGGSVLFRDDRLWKNSILNKKTVTIIKGRSSPFVFFAQNTIRKNNFNAKGERIWAQDI